MPNHLKPFCGCALLAALTFTNAACKGKPRAEASLDSKSEAPAGPPPDSTLLTMLTMSDPHSARQLAAGFFDLSAGAWRWTAGQFAVVLATPPESSSRGAKLQFHLTIPEPVIAKLNTLTLSAKAGDFSLPPQSFNKHGDYNYERDIPASALPGSNVRVEFSLDKTMPATATDHRQLGVIATYIGLLPK